MNPTGPADRLSQDIASPDAQNRVTRKRNRVPLSCGPCRHRKLKCNRSQPCDNCIKRGDAPSCTYASASSRRRPNPSTETDTPGAMQDRIDRLEGLVLALMTNGAQAVGPDEARAALSRNRPSLGGSSEQTSETTPMRDGGRDEDSEVEHMSKSIGVMKVQNDRQFYASEAHWWAILSDIAEVKRYFAEHTQQYEEQVKRVTAAKEKQGTQAATSLLFKGGAKVDEGKIRTTFPPRPMADSLIQRYFSTENPATHMLHGPTFRAEYERHWQNPSQTSIIWLGMCYALMSMALNSYHRAGDEPEHFRGMSSQLSGQYAEMTAQCLVAADFTQPVTYMIEALVLYALTEQARRGDAETGLWMLQSIIIRLAMRMGLHRDSEQYASISPYMVEMRRRVWTVIRSMDIMLSFQCGLPGMISSRETDTRLPSNIYDEEFYPNIEKLPPSRPSLEHTPVSYMIAHARIIYVLGRIQELNVSLTMPAYEQTMKFDAELREAYTEAPEHLRLQSRDRSSLDDPNLIMQRFTLDLAYHKSQCVLHRKFLARARKDARFAYSRRVCLEACLQMLEHQSTLSREGQQGGRLASVTWAVSTSMTTHDFLLAAMIVALDLYYTAQAEAEGQTSSEMYAWSLERRESMFAAIEAAMRVWETLKDQSMEAFKASNILRVMIEKLRNHQMLRQQLSQNLSFSNERHNGVAPDGNVAPEHSAAMTLGMMSSGLSPDAMGAFGAANGFAPAQQSQARSGLTPQPPMANMGTDINGAGLTPLMSAGQSANANANAASTPFANLFGPGFGGFEGLELPAETVDWDGWDTYIHGLQPQHGMFANSSANVFDTPTGLMDQFPTDGASQASFVAGSGAFHPVSAGKAESTQRGGMKFQGSGFRGLASYGEVALD